MIGLLRVAAIMVFAGLPVLVLGNQSPDAPQRTPAPGFGTAPSISGSKFGAPSMKSDGPSYSTQCDADMQKVDRIVTNGELTPGAQFHLLLLYGNPEDQITNSLMAMLKAPTREMRSWVQACNVRLMHYQEPQATEHHADLLQKHYASELPILAFIEHTENGKGAVWCSLAGRELPRSEAGLANWLGSYYQANIDAARQAGVRPNVSDNSLVNAAQNKLQNDGGSYFLPRFQAPEPTRFPKLRRPLFNPQVDVAMPDALETSVGLQDGAMMGIGAAVVAIVCSMILAYGRTQAAQIHANAITDDPDDDNGAK